MSPLHKNYMILVEPDPGSDVQALLSIYMIPKAPVFTRCFWSLFVYKFCQQELRLDNQYQDIGFVDDFGPVHLSLQTLES